MTFYLCDPDRNTKCTKERCYRNGGPCYATKNGMLARQAIGEFGAGPILALTYNNQPDQNFIRKRCEYCGCISEKTFGTCEHCGAPL